MRWTRTSRGDLLSDCGAWRVRQMKPWRVEGRRLLAPTYWLFHRGTRYVAEGSGPVRFYSVIGATCFASAVSLPTQAREGEKR